MMEREKLNAIVTKAKAGDPEAMNELITASYQDIYYYALKLVKKEDIAADAAQDSCVEIIETIGNLRESAAFVTWCRRIVYHQCAKRLGNTREVALEENEDGETILDRLPDETPGALPEQVAEDREFRKLMMDMIDGLPEGQRSALLLYYYERLSVKQIAEIQDENENTIKSRLHQGRNAVKKQVEAYEAKTGTRLHSVAILPLLYFLFQTGKTEADVAAAALLPGVQAAVAPTVAAATGTTAVSAGTTFLATLGGKITAGVLAAALTTGAVVGGIHWSNRSEPVPVLPETPPAVQTHTHSYELWCYDETAHWKMCQCEAASDKSVHIFENGICTDCGMSQPEEPVSNLIDLDYTTLAGHWLNITNDYQEGQISAFRVDENGVFQIMGSTYYPIGCGLVGTDADGNDMLLVALRETPVGSDETIVEGDLYSALVSVTLQKTGDCYSAKLLMVDPESYRVAFHNEFYRESDYAGYEKVALTPENFSEYVTVSFRPFEFYYFSHNASFMANRYMDLTLREDLGYPSWCQVQGKLYYSYDIVEYNVETQTYEIPDPSDVTVDEPLSVEFYGYKKADRVVETNGSNFPTDNVVRWFGKNHKSFTPETVLGYVFIPVQ